MDMVNRKGGNNRCTRWKAERRGECGKPVNKQDGRYVHIVDCFASQYTTQETPETRWRAFLFLFWSFEGIGDVISCWLVHEFS